jgi:hypothetical protein
LSAASKQGVPEALRALRAVIDEARAIENAPPQPAVWHP